MNVESRAHLATCMRSLGLKLASKPTHTVDARLRNEKTKASGTISVIFNCNWNSPDGPYIEFDEEIRGFDLQYRVYRPDFVQMFYDAGLNQLRIQNEYYEFVMDFC